VRKQTASAGRERWRWRVGNWPMAWKEIYIEGRVRFRWFGWILMLILLLASLLPGVLIKINRVGMPRPQITASMNHWTRVVGAIVACVLLVGVAVRAANSISQERDRLTWDS